MTTISTDEYIKILELPAKFKTMQQDEQLKALNSAWRAYSRKWHPDINKSTDAEARFKAGNEAHEKLLELIKNGGIKYSKPESKKEYNTSNDPFDEAIKELLKEFEKKINEKWKKEKEQTKLIILRIAGAALIAITVVLVVFKVPLLFIVIAGANLLAGKLKLVY